MMRDQRFDKTAEYTRQGSQQDIYTGYKADAHTNGLQGVTPGLAGLRCMVQVTAWSQPTASEQDLTK